MTTRRLGVSSLMSTGRIVGGAGVGLGGTSVQLGPMHHARFLEDISGATYSPTDDVRSGFQTKVGSLIRARQSYTLSFP